MKTLGTRLFIAFAVALVVAGTSQAAVVTLDFSSKSAKSDTKSLDPVDVQVDGKQIGTYIESRINEAQSFTLRVSGLKEKSYDVYVNGDYIGVKSTLELQQGMQISVPGQVGDPKAIRCFRALKPKVQNEYARVGKLTGPEAPTATDVLRQATDWVDSGIMFDQSYRSAAVVIAPQSSVLTPMEWTTRLEPKHMEETVTRVCWFLQKARWYMYHEVNERDLDNAVIVALTPVDFTANYSGQNGKPHIEVALVNNCNLPISGNITMSMPKGWKSGAKSMAFSAVKSGSTFKLAFDLIPTSKAAIVPAKLPQMTANVSMVWDIYDAKVKLTPNVPAEAAAAVRTKPTSAPSGVVNLEQ